jgi:hypothetical protein
MEFQTTRYRSASNPDWLSAAPRWPSASNVIPAVPPAALRILHVTVSGYAPILQLAAPAHVLITSSHQASIIRVTAPNAIRVCELESMTRPLHKYNGCLVRSFLLCDGCIPSSEVCGRHKRLCQRGLGCSINGGVRDQSSLHSLWPLPWRTAEVANICYLGGLIFSDEYVFF